MSVTMCIKCYRTQLRSSLLCHNATRRLMRTSISTKPWRSVSPYAERHDILCRIHLRFSPLIKSLITGDPAEAT